MAGDGEQHQEMMCTFGTVSFLVSTHSYVEHSMLCVARLANLDLHTEGSTAEVWMIL